MVARPLLHPTSRELRTQAARVAALTLDRRRLPRPSSPAAPSPPAAPVHPMGTLGDDPLAAEIAAAMARPAFFGRRLFRRAGLPPGLDPDLDAALAALDRPARLAVTLACWVGWEAPRIATLLGRPVPAARQLLAAALGDLAVTAEEVGRHLDARARRLQAPPAHRAPARALATAGAGAIAVGLALFAGAASAPLPTVGPPPELDPALLAEPEPQAPYPPAEALPQRETGFGLALDWAAVELPAGVAFRWVVPAGGGFVALGVAPGAAADPLVTPTGFWSSPDGRAWQPLPAVAGAFGEGDVVASIASGPDGIVAVGGARHAADVVVRPAAWRLAPGAAAWQRAGLRTAPLGGPASIRQVYDGLTVVAAGGDFVAYGRAGFAPTGRNLPGGFEYQFDELGVTLRGPGGATLERLRFDDMGLTGPAAARLASHEVDRVAWRSADGLRWDPVPVEAPGRLDAPAYAAGRFWSPAGGALASSADGLGWGPVALADTELSPAAVAGYPGGMVVATGGRTLLAADQDEWYTLVLPPGENALTGARWVAGGAAGVAAYGTMGATTGTVLVPQVTVPGRDAVMEADLFTGALEVVEADGTVRHSGRYYQGGTFRADFAAGDFQVVDGFGQVRMTGRVADWAGAVAAAHRTPYPPAGPISLWFSGDGQAWRLQTGLEARGFPSAVAVGDDRVVVAAVRPGDPAAPQLWVGTVAP